MVHRRAHSKTFRHAKINAPLALTQKYSDTCAEFRNTKVRNADKLSSETDTGKIKDSVVTRSDIQNYTEKFGGTFGGRH